MTKEKRAALIILVPIMGLVALIIGFSDDVPEEVKVKEVVVEREVKRDVLNLTAVYKVCHNGRRHWAVEYGNETEKGWFIAAVPDNEKCDGEEKVHPSHRDKVLKEMEEKKKKEGES